MLRLFLDKVWALQFIVSLFSPSITYIKNLERETVLTEIRKLRYDWMIYFVDQKDYSAFTWMALGVISLN